MAPVYAIQGWDQWFENRRSREVSGPLDYVMIHTQPLDDSRNDAYAEMMSTPHGITAYAVFIGLVRIAARCPMRGILLTDRGPLGLAILADRIRITTVVCERAILTLTEPGIGWVRTATDSEIEAAKSLIMAAQPPGTCLVGAGSAPPRAPSARRPRAGPRAETSSREVLGIGISAAAADQAGAFSPEEMRRRVAILVRRPDWLPVGKPWIDSTAAERLAGMATLTGEMCELVAREARDSRLTLNNPAGFFITRLEQAAKAAGKPLAGSDNGEK